jgi:putative ABC transport system permease protein
MRAWHWLLRLYPRPFRNEYGAEMTAIVTRRRRDVSGLAAGAWFWTATTIETLGDAARVHADQLRLDLRDAVRALARARGYAVTTVLVTALGVGATTAVFSVADHVLVRPLPFPEPDRLVRVWQDQSQSGYSRIELSPGNFRDWKAASKDAFSGLATFTNASMNLTWSGQPERLDGILASDDFFQTLGVRAALGRTFLPSDVNGPRPLVLAMPLYQRLFGGDPAVLGRTVTLDQTPHVVIGVMPEGFHFPDRDTEYWTLLTFEPDDYEDRTNLYLKSVGRLAPGATIEQARAQLQAVAADLERAFPEANAKVGATVVYLREEVGQRSRQMVIALAGAAAVLLLIACMNLTHLLLARALQRQRELSVRAALGASPERLIRQQLTESVLVAAMGGLAGVALALAAVPLIGRMVPTSLPVAELPALDLRMLAMAAGVTLATGIGFGLFPALRVSRARSLDALREGPRAGQGRRAERLRSCLVVTEIAASVVLLVAVGLLIHALWRVQQVDPGFRPDGVLTMRTALPMPAYRTAAAKAQFFDRVLTEVRALPGVTSAAYISFLPMVMRGGIWPITPEGEPEDPATSRIVSLRLVTPGFFETMGIPLLRGRDIRAADSRVGIERPPDGQRVPTVAVVSTSFVKDYLPPGEPIGRRFTMRFIELTIVGVVGDVRVRGLERKSEPQVYLPSAAMPDDSVVFYTPKDLVIRAGGDPMALAPAVRRIVHAADASQPVSDVRSLAAIVEIETGVRRTQLGVLVLFAGLAVLLAGVGIHGLLAYVVSSRTREIGVRVALGAAPASIVGLIVKRGLWLGAIGIAAGIAGAYAAGRALQALLAGVSPGDPGSFAAAAALSLAMALLGSVWPAIRAARVDPIVATRAE